MKLEYKMETDWDGTKFHIPLNGVKHKPLNVLVDVLKEISDKYPHLMFRSFGEYFENHVYYITVSFYGEDRI